MAKTSSDKLYKLIQTLSPAEKRYFRLFVRGKTARDSKYLQLFEGMAAMTALDEEVLKSSVYKGQTIEGKKYSELKAYLYDLLLKSLQSFDEQHSVEYRLNQLLQGVNVLFKRGHYEECRELLYKAEKLADQYEYFGHQLEIVSWEKHLAYTQMDVDFLHKNLEQLQYREDRALTQLRNTADYRKAFFRVYTSIKREATQRGEDRLMQLQSAVQQTAFSDPALATSHKARVAYYRTLNLYHYSAAEYAEFYDTGQKLIALIESQPHFLKENIADYIAALSNLILSCGLLGKYQEVELALQKLRNLHALTEDDRQKIHRQYFTNRFALCIYTGEFEQARQEMIYCQREATEFDPHHYETASFYFQYCVICFGCNDFSSALDYLNQWLNQPRSVDREDLQSLARMLSLILHFEMGNLVLLESLLRSATRFMQKKNRLFELERRFIHFMADLMRAANRSEQKLFLQKMKADLHVLPGAKSLLQTLDLEAWLESKITGRSFAAAVHLKRQAEPEFTN